jgi:hypothetical protein
MILRITTLAFLFLLSLGLFGQTTRPAIKVKHTENTIRIDGNLAEQDWYLADSISYLTMVEPLTSDKATYRTVTRILADSRNVYVGVICFDSEPDDIVAFTKARDTKLEDEDNIKIVLDTYFDGRNGFIFSINPFAARYDAIVSNNGESENANWDGIWEAKTSITDFGWVAEIKIPVSSLTYKNGLNKWGFNIERRVQRLIEVDRWTAISQDYKLGQTIHAGVLDDLPTFDLGLGMTPSVSAVTKISHKAGEKADPGFEPSFDILQRITPDITAQLTVNTDFAETEVDSRQTNLTRFPVLYPEKRQFFLEGADIYDFGLGLGRNFMPFFSRRIGLTDGTEIPVRWGAKVNGKVKNTQFGVLVNETAGVEGISPQTVMGVARIRQNILKESSFGLISTIGDPSGIDGSWMTGADFTYQTSEFKGNKNFMAGIWGLYNDREDLVGDKSAFGLKIDYPNDLWDIALQYRRIGDAFDPSLGFVPRKNINFYYIGASYMPRPDNKHIRQHMLQSRSSLYTNLDGEWESYDIFTAPIHFLLESGDRFEFNFRPQGENLTEEFEIADGVVIEEGSYHWRRYRLEVATASKRQINGQATWWFGGFYGGTLDQIQFQLAWRPISSLILEMTYERNIGNLPVGNFTQDLIASRVQVNMTSNLNLSTYIQYDNESRSMGSYSRFRWTFAPRGDLFIVYKHNMTNDITNRWDYDSSQFIFKLTYGLWL